MEMLSLEHVGKSFGALRVLSDLSFSVAERSVFGLIGRNGAGKTTTMKLIVGLLRADGGEIRVCGEPVRYGQTKTNRFIGYLPDVPEFYGYMKPAEYLRLCGGLVGLEPQKTSERTKELLTLVGLEGVTRKIGGFSRGMKQRLGIAQALLGEPRLLICDEPTSALDPVGRKEILDILSVAGQQTAIVFSTHILSDVERICDRIGVLDGGRLVLEGKLSELKSGYRHDSVRVEFDAPDAAAPAEKLRSLPFVQKAEAKENSVTVRLADAEAGGRKVLEYLLREQVPISKYEVLEPTLEDVFLEAIR
jgi:ABC-2 type transport system ATP-binding protein